MVRISMPGRQPRTLSEIPEASKYDQARPIDCFVKEGESIKMGQKVSFIKRGSQVDLIVYKKELNFKVKVGQQVYGSKTILASNK